MAGYTSLSFGLDCKAPTIGGPLSANNRTGGLLTMIWSSAAVDTHWTDNGTTDPRAGYEFYVSNMSIDDAKSKVVSSTCFLWRWADDTALDVNATLQTIIDTGNWRKVYVAMFLRDDFNNTQLSGNPVLFFSEVSKLYLQFNEFILATTPEEFEDGDRLKITVACNSWLPEVLVYDSTPFTAVAGWEEVECELEIIITADITARFTMGELFSFQLDTSVFLGIQGSIARVFNENRERWLWTEQFERTLENMGFFGMIERGGAFLQDRSEECFTASAISQSVVIAV